MTDFFTSEPMHYWSTPASMSGEEKRIRLQQLINSGNYLWSEKTDGNWARAIISPEHAVLQTRGISKKTGNYGEIQDKVLFWPSIEQAFQSGTTVILGEVWMEGCIDRDIGAILRCLVDKARKRQEKTPLKWRIFDVLALDGQELLNKPVTERVTHIPEVVARINNPLVSGVEYHEMDENFFEDLNDIFAAGGEGVVCYHKNAKYVPGKRGPSAWDSVKVKQEIAADVDVFITGVEPAIQEYTGKELESWQLWQDTRTGQKLKGSYYMDYKLGKNLIPISKGFYYNWPGAIIVGVYNKNHEIVNLCKVAGLTEEFKVELRDNFEEWYMCPLTIGGMMVSTATSTPSIRHPYLKSIRKGDLNPDDCTLAKILTEELS